MQNDIASRADHPAVIDSGRSVIPVRTGPSPRHPITATARLIVLRGMGECFA